MSTPLWISAPTRPNFETDISTRNTSSPEWYPDNIEKVINDWLNWVLNNPNESIEMNYSGYADHTTLVGTGTKILHEICKFICDDVGMEIPETGFFNNDLFGEVTSFTCE